MTTDVLNLGKQRAEELGLERFNYAAADRLYRADDVHKLLGEGVVTYTRSETKSNFNRVRFGDDDMVALQVGIRPIVQETREQKMEALLRQVVRTDDEAWYISKEWYDRAKDLLEGK